MFEGFPHLEHEGLFKAYYLIQASYWSQQALVLVLQLERPRTDYHEFAAHHVITLALIWLSYRFHFTYIGLAVYITHDISDFGLAVSPDLLPIVFGLTMTASDSEGSELPKFSLNRRILCSVHSRLDLHSSLPQPADSVGCTDRVRNRRPVRTQLGDSTV